jgi:uncharacterized protein (TIGR00369 family)
MDFKPQTPRFREIITDHLSRQEFMKHIGCRLTVIEPGYVEAVIDIGVMHQQQIGLVHGGVTATIADVAAGFAGFTLIKEHEQTVTGEIKISYLVKAVGKQLRAVGRVIKAGRSVHFCEADVFCDDVLVARASTTMFVIRSQQ